STLNALSGQGGRQSNVVDGAGVDHWRRGSNVQEDVVIRRIIGNAIATADNGLFMSRQPLENARCPGKAKVGAKVVKVLGDIGDLCDAGRQACRPESACYVLYADVVQQVHCLLVPLPAQS